MTFSVLDKRLIFAIWPIMIYYIQLKIKEVKTMLKKNFELLQRWCYKNHMVLNTGKCHYLMINTDIANESMELGKKTLHAEAEQKLLVIKTDKELNFQSHTKSIIKATNQKLCALTRVAQVITDLNKIQLSSSIIVPYYRCLALEL